MTKYAPITLCATHNVSMHDTARAAHESTWASPEYPCSYSYQSDAVMRAAGWAEGDFTSWPYMSAAVAAECEFWTAHYAA
jgi:hypothetical protein